jgi:hypothetical protein
MAPVDPNILANFQDKSVILTVVGPDGDAVQVTGKVEGASAVGLAFKEKGKREVKLVEPKNIEEIVEAPTEAKKVTQKKLKPLEKPEQARQHLADRHGYNRSDLNKMSDADAFKFHNDLDHSDLGHKHVAEKDEAGDSTETEPADDAA